MKRLLTNASNGTDIRNVRRRGGRSRGARLLAFLVLPLAAATPGAPPVFAAEAIEGLQASPRLSADPPEGMLVDAWYRLELLEQPVGYMRSASRRQGDRIESLDYLFFQVARGPVTVQLATKTKTVETVDGRPLEIHTEQVFANQPVRYDAVFQPDGKIDLRITQGDNVVRRTLDADPRATLPWGLLRSRLTGRRKPGESFTERTYSFDTDTKPLTVRHEAAGQADVRLPNGQTVRTWRYRVTNEALGSPGEVYCEPQWLIPIRLVLPIMNLKLTATITTRDKAVAATERAPAELFVSMLIRATVAGAEDPSRAPRVLYTLTLPEDTPPPPLVATSMQRVVGQDGRSIRLLVTRRAALPPAAAKQDLSPQERQMYLAATAYANSDDAVVRRLAAEGAGDQTDPARVAESLCRFVYARVRNKGFDIAFATASETARTLHGDCTEHAVLLAALARARGLPARAALGMVAMPGSFTGQAITLGYHMWTQIHVDGRWMDFDAALNQPVPDATHVALGISDLTDTSVPLESVRAFSQIAGRVQIAAQANP